MAPRKGCQMHTARWFAIYIVAGLLGVAALACGGGGKSSSGSSAAGSTAPAGAAQGAVNVLGIWGSTELDAFNAMVKNWNGQVNFTGSRDITSLLTTRVQGGSPPDVAIPAEVGLFKQFV